MRIVVARLHVARQPVVGRRAALGVAGDVVGGDGERRRRRPARTGPSANVPSRILGPCRSARIAIALAGVVGGLADVLVDLLVVGVVAVAEVEPGDVHAGIGELADLLVRVR